MKIQWVFVDGVEWKSYIVDISMLYDFHSTTSTNIHWIFNFHLFYSIYQCIPSIPYAKKPLKLFENVPIFGTVYNLMTYSWT